MPIDTGDREASPAEAGAWRGVAEMNEKGLSSEAAQMLPPQMPIGATLMNDGAEVEALKMQPRIEGAQLHVVPKAAYAAIFENAADAGPAVAGFGKAIGAAKSRRHPRAGARRADDCRARRFGPK